MHDEIASLESNHTWQVIKRANHMHGLHNKWVLKKKMNVIGSIERYKAILLAEGDDLVLGRDYNLKFAAIFDMTNGKISFAIARLWNVRARHFDVPSAYRKSSNGKKIEITMRVLRRSDDQLRKLNVENAGETCLRLIKDFKGSIRPADCGTSCSTKR